MASPHDILTADAFKRLYPDKYARKLLGAGHRPDGRPLDAEVDCSIGLQPVSTAASSALVKVGSTMVMSGTRLRVASAEGGEEAAGAVTSSVELTPMCAPSLRPGRQSDLAVCLTEEVSRILRDSGALLLEALLVEGGKAAWQVTLDLCVLDADGSLLDACLLAAVSALAALRIPQGRVSDTGKFVAASQPSAAPALVDLQRAPFALTSSWHEGGAVTLPRPSEEEQRLAGALVVVACNSLGQLQAVEKSGSLALTPEQVLQCVEAAAKAQAALSAMLAESLRGLKIKPEPGS